MYDTYRVRSMKRNQIVSQYMHDWTPMNTIVITEIRDRCETTQMTSHYLIYLFANLFITIISVNIYYLLNYRIIYLSYLLITIVPFKLLVQRRFDNL